MSKCFVMQPFDAGVFDKRFDDVFSPAILEAGLEPYRVDRDPAVNIPIDDIEAGIRKSEICLAEITTDNPNVWFELGFAIAIPKEVILVCSDERRSKFPFDVQHRKVIKYKTEAPQDFQQLKQDICLRIQALVKKIQKIDRISGSSPIKKMKGLSQHEMVALVCVMQNGYVSDEGVSAWQIKNDMSKSGFTDIAVSLALSSLKKKDMVLVNSVEDNYGNYYSAYFVTPTGEEWLLANQEQLVLKKDDDISF